MALLYQAQQSQYADTGLLSRIKVRVAENGRRLPNYTCGEIVERFSKSPRDRKPQALDTVRLEVALVEGKELYGWQGANRIAESELSTLVGGMIGNGNFGLLPKAIFEDPATQYTYQGLESMANKRAHRFDYKVPRPGSGYRVKIGASGGPVGFHGSFWVDEAGLDLLRIELVADDMPPILGLEATSNTLEYERVPIGGADFLLPKFG